MGAHDCKALVLHCIDFRFRKYLNDFLNSKFGNSYDLVAVAGGVKQLLVSRGRFSEASVPNVKNRPGEDNFILEQLKISDRLHKPGLIVLIQHEDCGAYGGSVALGDFSTEQETQNAELEKAEALLKEQFFQPAEKYFACLSGEMIKL